MSEGNEAERLSVEELNQKVEQYEAFIEKQLKVQLQQVLEQRDAIYTKISQL